MAAGVLVHLGGPYMKGIADTGTSIIYAPVLISLLKLNYFVGPSRRNIDWHLEEHISSGWRVAEMRYPGYVLGFQNLDISNG